MEARSMGSENHQTIETRYTIKATTIVCKWPGATSTIGCEFALHHSLFKSRYLYCERLILFRNTEVTRETKSCGSSR